MDKLRKLLIDYEISKSIKGARSADNAALKALPEGFRSALPPPFGAIATDPCSYGLRVIGTTHH